MERHVRVQFFIPTRNNADCILQTLDSIWAQDYPREDIYVTVMDFESSDGTYEKLMAYDPYHMGVYQDKTTTNPRLMIEKMARIGFVHPGGWYCFKCVLYPGDIVYPDYLKICTKAFIDTQAQKPASLICETDLFDDEGGVIHQPSLFEEDRIIDGNYELRDYICRGFQHQIQCMVYVFGAGLVRQVGQSNEQRWWNKWAAAGNENIVVYIKEPLACQRRMKYADELEEILLRWEWIITIIRTQEARFGTFQDDSFYRDSRHNNALYAIWRSYLLTGCGKMKDAEDCLLISGVLDQTVEEEEVYKRMSRYLADSSAEDRAFLDRYFEINGWN